MKCRVVVLALALAGCATTGTIRHEKSGSTTTIAALRGHVVVLNFWAEWCPPCIKELPVLAQLVQDAGPDVVLIPAYYDDRPSPNSKFHGWLANQPPFFRDRVCWADLSVRVAHDLSKLPLTVVYGRDGAIVETFVGSIDRRTEAFGAALTRALQTTVPAPVPPAPP